MTIVRHLTALMLCACASGVSAQEESSGAAERWQAALESSRWTGPMLASTPETLPKGHFYTEPYFFDVMSGGEHYPGSSGFYQYGLADNFTVGFQPSLSWGTQRHNRGPASGDLKLLSQVRLNRFTAGDRVPSVALVLNATLPTGKHDRLAPLKQGRGSGAFVPEVGVNAQHYFMLGNGRLLRTRLNLLKTLPMRADVTGRSVYGTGNGFHGEARRGSTTTAIAAVEYSLTREWVLAFDVIAQSTERGWVRGRVGNGPAVRTTIPNSRSVGFAPAVEYNWSDRSGVLLGVWITPKGHNSAASVTPALAYSRFW